MENSRVTVLARAHFPHSDKNSGRKHV